MRWLAQELTNARKEHAAAIVAHAAKHDDLDVKLNAAQKAHEQACTLRQFRHICCAAAQQRTLDGPVAGANAAEHADHGERGHVGAAIFQHRRRRAAHHVQRQVAADVRRPRPAAELYIRMRASSECSRGAAGTSHLRAR